MWALEWRLDFDRREPYRYRHHDAIAVFKRLVELGARLTPADTDELQFLRRCLLKLDWAESYKLIKFLHEHEFAQEATMTGLLKAPKMREHLNKRLSALARIFPALKKGADKACP